jgi:DNA-binding transcriptional MerR regulator
VKAGVMGSRRPDVAGSSRLFFRAGEVSRMVGVAEHVLRYWESEFPQLTPHRNRAGQRVYRLRDVHIVFLIHELLYDDKCTLADARGRLEDLAATTWGTPLGPNEAG